jgi:hypothetical protein
MAQAREVVPVMDAKTAPRARGKAAGAAKTTRKGLGGQYGASFTGEGTRGLTFERRWTRPGIHPYDEITWEYRTAGISSETGKTVFEQKDVEVPAFWSQLATNVVVSKYFRGHVGTPEREHSVKQLIDRVVSTICAGPRRSATSPRTRTLRRSRLSSPTCSSTRRWRSTRRSGSTSGSSSARNAVPASSIPSRTT